MRLITFALTALVTLYSFTAHAGIFKIDLLAPSAIPSNNEFRGNIPLAERFYTLGGNLQANQAGELTLEFSFLDKEAGRVNTFESEGFSINTTTDKTPFAYTKAYSAGDLIDFHFSTSVLAAPFNSVLNGNNTTTPLYVSFAIALDTLYKGELYDAILFFDDGGVNYEDDNHDDLLIGIKAKANVPESSALILMLMGLAGLFAARRMKA
jgi:hypothetical protein